VPRGTLRKSSVAPSRNSERAVSGSSIETEYGDVVVSSGIIM
jgi:hypothetical protein